VETETVELLSGVDLFSSLSNDQLQVLSQVVITKTYNKDETIILEDDESVQALFLIAQGEVKVFMTGTDGRETILTLLAKGDFFGEMSLVDGEPRSASVRAVTDSKLLIIRREDFMAQIEKFPDLAMSLLVEMSRRMRKANRQIGSLALLTVYGRVAGTILNLVEERGVRIHGDGGKMVTVIRNRPTQQQMAEMSGTTRETVSRVLSSLQKKGIISMGGKDLVILQEEDLKAPQE
jgi:CRP/FNR family transcriptional regulator/CRP/FNR family cyclic AMP-dependent transcriptional regulator